MTPGSRVTVTVNRAVTVTEAVMSRVRGPALPRSQSVARTQSENLKPQAGPGPAPNSHHRLPRPGAIIRRVRVIIMMIEELPVPRDRAAQAVSHGALQWLRFRV